MIKEENKNFFFVDAYTTSRYKSEYLYLSPPYRNEKTVVAKWEKD